MRSTPIRQWFAGRLRRVRFAAAAARRDQAGYSLIEVLIVAGLLAVILGALMEPMLVSQRDQARNSNYAFAQQSARTQLDSMVAQVRQATSVIASSGNSIEMTVTLNGTSLLVDYECDIAQPGAGSYRECVRVQAPAGGTLPALSTGAVIVRNLLNGTTTAPVFSWGPDPTAPYYMTATVEVPASGAKYGGLKDSLVFSDGALMRNLNVGN